MGITSSVRFNATANRLLCKENSTSLVVYELYRLSEKVELKAPGFSSERPDLDTACFARRSVNRDDDLVAAKSDKGLVVWSVPRSPFGEMIEIAWWTALDSWWTKLQSISSLPLQRKDRCSRLKRCLYRRPFKTTWHDFVFESLCIAGLGRNLD